MAARAPSCIIHPVRSRRYSCGSFIKINLRHEQRQTVMVIPWVDRMLQTNSKTHLTPNDGVANLSKMLTYSHVSYGLNKLFSHHLYNSHRGSNQPERIKTLEFTGDFTSQGKIALCSILELKHFRLKSEGCCCNNRRACLYSL